MKRTKKNTSNTLIVADNKAKSRNSYYSIGQWNLIATEKTYAMVTKELAEWVDKNPDMLCVEEFLMEKKMSPSTFMEWRKAYPPLEETYQYVLMSLGIRRERGAINKNYDANIISMMMPHYSGRWKDMIEWRSDLKRKEAEKNNSGSIIAVMMPQTESSPMVPVKKIEEREE